MARLILSTYLSTNLSAVVCANNKVIRLVGRTYVRVNVLNCSFNDYTLGPSPLSVVCTQLYGCYKLLIGSRNSFSTTAQIVVDRKNDSLISRR